MKKGKHLRIKKRNLRTVELLHLALLEAKSEFACSRETLVSNLINLLVTINYLKGELEKTKINNRGIKPCRLVTLLWLHLLNI